MPRCASILLLTSLLLTGCASLPKAAPPTLTPTVFQCDRSGTVDNIAVDPATEIEVYLPPCYDAHAARAYPVIYLFPGYTGVAADWPDTGLQKTADAAILSRAVPAFIAVSMDDPFPDINGNMLVDTVLPFVESRYRAGGARNLRATAGGSFGGAVAYHLAFKHPELFASAGIFGNGAAFGEEDSIRAWLAAIPAELRPRVFINCGAKDTYMTERAKALLPILDAAGIAHMEIFGPGGHDFETWQANFPAFLRWTALDWEAKTHAE
jgi:enterochelin esterase-like enzyme